ncbi:glycosyltransferase [Streptomyces sp. NPDC059985]|uniref:glycosyltransferase family 4 protein n=1 Tax=Streptomyces sp. NPDC059985 TaxID=3347025 RepID=UPI0036B41A78
MAEKRYNILVVSDNSGRGEGGVEVFNQELAESLARRHNVTLFTANPDMPQHEGIQQEVTTRPPEGVKPRHWIEYLAGQEPTGYGLEDPASRPYDIIIGHSRFSGPAAAEMRENWFQDARVVHFLHTSPERLPFVKGLPLEVAREKAAEDTAIERETMARADVVAGVGPLLSEASRGISAEGANIPHSHEIIPGTRVHEPVQHGPVPERLNILVMGRVDDPLKGVADAAKAVAMLNEAGTSVHLTVRGVPDEDVERATKELARLSGGNVTVKPRTRDVEELNEDIRGSHAVIMPSKHEGYGLVAPEGLAHGVPVLVNEESGAALFFQDPDRVPAEMGQRCVVPEPTDGSDRAVAWFEAIGRLKEDLPQRQADALHLREVLQQYSWDHATEALVKATMEQTPLPHRGPELMLSAQERDRARTVQGPNGQVIRPEAPEQGQQAQAGIGVQRDGPGQEKPGPQLPQPAWQVGFTHNQPAAGNDPRTPAPGNSAPAWQAGFTQNQPGAAGRRGTASPGRGAGASGPGQVGPEQSPPGTRGDGIGM